MRLDQVFCDGEPDSAINYSARMRFVNPVEASKQMGQAIGQDAGTGIAYHHLYSLFHPLVADRYFSTNGCALQGISYQVQQDLMDAVFVDQQRR